jgi:hypothetical protein
MTKKRKAIFVAATGIIALTANAADDQEFVIGGDFSAGSGNWYTYGGGAAGVVNGQYCFDPADSANPWDAAFGINGLELAEGATNIQLSKKGSDWMIVKPLTARADFAVVESSLERVGSAQMVGITEENATDLAKYGLDKPSATINVAMGSSRATLLLGKTENAVVYAKDASRPMVFTVAPTLKTDVIKPVSEFRRKDLFDARAFTTTHIEFKRGNETIVLDKSKGKDDKDVWKNGAGKEVDSQKAEDLVNRVTGLRASSFENQAHASLKMPALTVTIRSNDNKTETVTFGRTATDVYATRSDEPGSAKIDGTAALDEAMKLLDGVK